MHPARSQGMNISMRCVHQLSKHLTDPAALANATAAAKALEAYENEMKPVVDRMLEANHEAGLQMDKASPELSKQLADNLKTLQADPEAMHAYAMRAAGFA